MDKRKDFDWDEDKRQKKLEKHRMAATGIVEGDYLTVIYTWRSGQRRIISARPARRKERQSYENARQDHERPTR